MSRKARLIPRPNTVCFVLILATAVLAACGGNSSSSTESSALEATKVETRSEATTPTSVSSTLAALALPPGSQGAIAAPRAARQAEVDVWVQLADPSVAQKSVALRSTMAGAQTKAAQGSLRSQMTEHKQSLKGQQDAAVSFITGMGARELGRVHVAHNAIAVRISAARVSDLSGIPGVVAVRPVRHYEMALGETVPYVGAAAAQAVGKDGSGVRVAVLDSGIDYTHRNMGGAGTAAAYAAAYGAAPGDALQTTRDGLFPTAKVVDGFDFVGEAWPNCAAGTDCRTEDPDPIDLEGHGTHVADIIAGIGPNKGMAPGAKLVAIKVCSAVATSCNGVALLKAVDFALDPNGDGSMADAVDVMNLSLGSSYGQEEDDLTFALANAVSAGVSVVVSAGNSADRPYIVGSPSIALGVLSVAQTQVPSAVSYALVVTGITPSTIVNTASVDWAPIGAGFNGAVAQVGRGCPADSVAAGSPEDPFFNGNSPAGKVALIDRGGCSISLKVDRATKAGALGVIIANNAGGDPPSFSFGGGTLPMVPTIVISQADGARIKTALGATGLNPAVVASISQASAISVVGGMVASSSRGPSSINSALKPEIGAPGASVSAEATTGNGETAFGGTSGASPMVAGAAAILRGAYPDRTPEQIKAMLMNAATTAVYTNPATQPGVLAPVSRIGAGELRVDRALALQSVAYNSHNKTAAVSFGFHEVNRRTELRGELTVENFSDAPRTYSITSNYRYADDAASGATRLHLPRSITVPAHGSRTFHVGMRVDGTRLPDWGLNGGALGGRGDLLQANEVDGYITLVSGNELLSVPFHALLRKSASVNANRDEVRVGRDLRLRNNGANDGFFDAFALTGTSPAIPASQQPGPGDNKALIDLRAVGVRMVDTQTLQFAVSRYDRRAHPVYPAEIDILIDANNDGKPDYLVFNRENGTFASTGQTLVAVVNLTTSAASAFYYLDADLQSGNGIFTVPLAAIGLTPSSKFSFSVEAYDNYFTGNLTDSIASMSFTPQTPRYALSEYEGPVPASDRVELHVSAPAGGDAASPSQTGFLLLYRSNEQTEAEIVTIRNR